MFKTLPILLLATVATCQNTGDLSDLFDQIFSPSSTTTSTTTLTTAELLLDKSKGPSTNVPSSQPAAGDDSISCTMPDGQVGECVPFYLCKEDNNAAIDLLGIIDVGDGLCMSYVDTCCLPSNKIYSVETTKPPQREGCGWANPDGAGLGKTIGINEESKFGEFPWVVAILKIEPVNETNPEGQNLNVYVGGGSLIHPSVVLTAAHHVAAGKALRVRAGEWDTQTTKEIYPYQERDVTEVKIHQDFNAGNLFYDVAVLFLDKPMDLAPNVGVACLPPSRLKQEKGARCFATGWGKDKFGKEGRYQAILKKVEVPVVDHYTCQSALQRTRLGNHFLLHSSFMCAGGEAGKDTCKPDSGSPLSCPIENEKDRYVQSGIVAWGIGCGDDGTPGVYVDVSVMRDWVDNHVAGKGYDLKTYSY